MEDTTYLWRPTHSTHGPQSLTVEISRLHRMCRYPEPSVATYNLCSQIRQHMGSSPDRRRTQLHPHSRPSHRCKEEGASTERKDTSKSHHPWWRPHDHSSSPPFHQPCLRSHLSHPLRLPLGYMEAEGVWRLAQQGREYQPRYILLSRCSRGTSCQRYKHPCGNSHNPERTQ